MSKQYNFSGRWQCVYWYPSNERDEQDTSEYVVEVFQRGNKLTVDSLPNDINSHMTVNLTVDGRLATGAWLENTSPQGEFEGLVYSGALQLLVSDDGQRMSGKWVGIGREHLGADKFAPQIYSGDWKMTKVTKATETEAEGES